ncbi:Nn.00g002060.m01.CDS01 [Neocucurbitaria sp. VM-36]
MNQRLAISLTCLDGGMQYARVDAGSLTPIDDWPNGQLKTIYVRQKLFIPPEFTTQNFRSFHISGRIANQRTPPARIISVHPREHWDEATHELQIANDTATDVFGALLLRVQSPAYAGSLTFPVAFGFNRANCHYWVRALPDFVSAADSTTRSSSWPEEVKRRIPDEVYDARRGNDLGHHIFFVGNSGLGMSVSIRASLLGDSITLQVHIDGLVKWQ